MSDSARTAIQVDKLASKAHVHLADSVREAMHQHTAQMEDIATLLNSITSQLVYLGTRSTGATFINEVKAANEEVEKMPDNLVCLVASHTHMVERSGSFIKTSLQDIANNIHDISSTLVGVENEKARGA